MADDDPVSLELLRSCLRKWGYDVQTVADGAEALEALTAVDGPTLAILDWMMPIHPRALTSRRDAPSRS